MESEILIQYRSEMDCWANGRMLAKLMQSERQAHTKRGFFFDYGLGETASFKNFSEAVVTAAGFMMQAARDTRKSVRVFRNMNGEIAAQLKG